MWQKPVARELSNQVKKSVMTQFHLDSQTVDKMRFSGKKGRYSNRPVNYLRIFDPVLIKKGESVTPGYNDFELADSGRTALLFEGHVEKVQDNEQVFLSDRSAP
jgi:hypothetical protein